MSAHFFPPARRGEPIRPILQRALERQGLGRKLERRISPSVWEKAVGKELASRMQPTSLVGGVLHVLVQDHRWRDQLDAARGTLIARINASLAGLASPESLRTGPGAALAQGLAGARAPLVRELRFGLAHAGALDAACLARERLPEARAEPAPQSTLGAHGAHLEPSLRDALLRVAGAASRRGLKT